MSIYIANKLKTLEVTVNELLDLTTEQQKQIENLKKQLESLQAKRGRPPKDKNGRTAD